MVPGVAGWPFFVAAASSQTVSSDQPTRPTSGFFGPSVGGDEVVELGRLHQVQGNDVTPEVHEVSEQAKATWH